MIDTVIISDLHIGSLKAILHRRRLAKFLNSITPSARLILLGDVVEYITDNAMPSELDDYEPLFKRFAKRIWVMGNHDHAAGDCFQGRGYITLNIAETEIGGRKFACMHGHQFDRFCMEPRGFFNHGIIQINQRLNRALGYDIERAIRKRLNLTFDRDDEMSAIKKKAVTFRIEHSFDYVILGHTHKSEIDGNRGYANSGDCCGSDTALLIDDRGKLKLESF